MPGNLQETFKSMYIYFIDQLARL